MNTMKRFTSNFTTVISLLLTLTFLFSLLPCAYASGISAEDWEILMGMVEEEEHELTIEELYDTAVHYSFEWGTDEDLSRTFYPQNAIDLCVEGAKNGDPKALYLVGFLAANGIGTEQDDSTALLFFKQAAEAGDVNAMCVTGILYANQEDYQTAMDWYAKAADQGSAYAMSNIGSLYFFGNGVEQDYSAAVTWFTSSAEKGYYEAMGFLSNMYAYGDGVEMDEAKAQEWNEKYETGLDEAMNWKWEKPTDTPSGNAADTTGAASEPEEQTVSVVSKITGEPIIPVKDHSVGSYVITLNPTSDGVAIPYPETAFPGGYTFHSVDIGSDNTTLWYAFSTSSSEYDAEKYWNLLAENGFDCSTETVLMNKKYHASINGLPDIVLDNDSVVVKRGTSISLMLPGEYSFALSGEPEIRSFETETSFTPNDWDNPKDSFFIYPYADSVKKIKAVFDFKPNKYPEGTCYTLDDFLDQGFSAKNYSCDLYCSDLTNKRIPTYDDVLSEKNGYQYYEALDVEVLKNSGGEVILYTYIRATNLVGTTFEMECVSSFSGVGESSASADAFDENGTCKNCGGNGKVECTSCNGKGEEKCSLCRGSGRIVNGFSQKIICTRCGGLGESDCIRCENGRRTCRVCGGKGCK